MKNIKNTELLKNVYNDYKQLKAKIIADLGITNDLEKAYNYIKDLKGASFTNVDLETMQYFDFNYKDICLTIYKSSLDNGICKLAENIEIWNDKTNEYIGSVSFRYLERLFKK